MGRTLSNLSEVRAFQGEASASTSCYPFAPALRSAMTPDRCPSYLSLGSAFPESRRVSLASMTSTASGSQSPTLTAQTLSPPLQRTETPLNLVMGYRLENGALRF